MNTKRNVGCKKGVYLKGCIGKMMGFAPAVYSGLMSYTGPYVYNLKLFDYIALFVNDFDRIDSPNENIDGSFCIFPLDSDTGTFNVTAKDVDNVKYIKYFNPPINEISKLRIKFKTPTGEIFDFVGQNHLLIFEINTLFGNEIIKNIKQVAL